MALPVNVPARGTKAACRYWASRTRQSLWDADAAFKRGEYAAAEDIALQASGEAAEYAEAMRALVDNASAQ
jgi:hypothetical protein